MAKSQVTTFYSYKGGSGRSMTLANVAWALASNDERVLAIDWDLEAPGLHRYFHPFLSDPDQGESKGLIDRVWDYIEQLGAQPDRKDRFKLADCSDIVQPLDLPLRGSGCLDFIGAGRQDERYSHKVGGLDWNGFYQRFDGEEFINAILKWARHRYTHVLIDSRTGVADTAGICTSQLPDALVLCLVYNRQSIEGTAAIARSIKEARKTQKKPSLKMEFVPSRVEERSTVEAARRHTAQRFIDLIDGGPRKVEQSLRRAEVRNYPWCAFEEKLAVFEEYPDERGSLLDAMHDLARRITGSSRIAIRPVDGDVLSSYWRRAAFDDPRLFDLRAISDQPTLDAWTQVQFWLDDAVANDGERPEWLMSLAEAAMGFVLRRDNRLSLRTAATFAETAEQLARRAYNEEPTTYATRYALILDDIAGLLQRNGEFEKALSVSLNAERLWQADRSPIAKWRHARLLDRRAAILDTLGRSDEVIATYKEIAEIYRVIGRRVLPVGNEIEPARTQRLLASKLLERGDAEGAERAIVAAVKLLSQTTSTARDRDLGEIIEILITRLRVATEIGDEAFEKVARQVLLHADRLLPAIGGRERVQDELFLFQSELYRRHGQFDEALFRIESTSADFQSLPRVALQKAEILVDAGRQHEAMETMLANIRSGSPLTEKALGLFRRAIGSSEHGGLYFDELLSALTKSDEQGASTFIPAVRALTDKMRHDGTDFSQLVPLLQTFIRKPI